ncbi:MAG: sigma-70 family RNA polymerase sigma factor [Calditrichia bacterium]|nr:sigma-70 family RNA polymerase sigma factor [Calditrichia bacterium]
MNEVEVVKRAKQGDQQAFSELVNAYSERIYNLGLRILRKKEDAEDILQETFLTVIQKIDMFDGRSSFFTWIYRIATNTALMKLRKKKPQYIDLPDNPDFQESIESKVFIDWSQDASLNVQNAEVKKLLYEAIDELSEIYKTVFILRDIEQLSIKETSKILNITEENVKIRLRRARQHLRDKLSEYFSERVVK